MSAHTGALDAIAAYAHALDAGQAGAVVDLFTEDGVSDIVGFARYAGHDELLDGYTAMAPTGPQLHLVSNTVVTSERDAAATAVSDLAFFSRDEDGWVLKMVGCYSDTFELHEHAWLFRERVLTFI